MPGSMLTRGSTIPPSVTAASAATIPYDALTAMRGAGLLISGELCLALPYFAQLFFTYFHRQYFELSRCQAVLTVLLAL